ncbi:MAG TPA: TIGR03000 domain-containing protein [Gemmataceae bacterium]|nr:TIGR03000 domain-containing protein [Gemmataceae bacterium]
MYSVILMAALTTSVDLPDTGRRGGCCGGCYGGCHGGRGGRGGRGGGCHGCYGGGYGGCMGMGYGGCMGGGYGGCMGMGYGGCYGGAGCYGGGMGGIGGGMIMPGTTVPATPEKTTMPKEKKTSQLSAPATILVELPNDAKLLIDNEATTSIGTSRVFQSPTLNAGKEYHYTLTAEVVRDGKPIKAEQVVTVKAGEITPVTLTLPPVGVAQR